MDVSSCWEQQDPAARFWRRLIRERAQEFMEDPSFMKALRCRPEDAKDLQRRFGSVWAEYGTDVYKLIATACGETWDAEDEEKNAFALQAAKKESAINQNNDDLVAAREVRSRERVDELQGIVEESLSVLEKEEGRKIRGLISCVGGAEEAAAAEKEEKRRRREDFYRRAGGTS